MGCVKILSCDSILDIKATTITRMRKMRIFNDINDIRKYLTAAYECVCMECFDCKYEDLINKVSIDFIDFVESNGYIYGQEFDESIFTDEIFWGIIDKYQI